MAEFRMRLDLQRVADDPAVPPREEWLRWASAAAGAAEATRASAGDAADLTIRLVDHDESAALNARFRHREGPTNVLAFGGPESAHGGAAGDRQLGDLVICLPLAFAEAREQSKDPASHLAHLTVHGTLHLLGYDHDSEKCAAQMEQLETDVMAGLGYPDPYAWHAVD